MWTDTREKWHSSGNWRAAVTGAHSQVTWDSAIEWSEKVMILACSAAFTGHIRTWWSHNHAFNLHTEYSGDSVAVQFVPKCNIPTEKTMINESFFFTSQARNRGGSSSSIRVKLLHRDCLIAHYWLSCLQHTFLLWPLEAPSSLCVTSSLSRWSWRSYSYSMKWSLNFSMGTTWTMKEKMQTRQNH